MSQRRRYGQVEIGISELLLPETVSTLEPPFDGTTLSTKSTGWPFGTLDELASRSWDFSLAVGKSNWNRSAKKFASFACPPFPALALRPQRRASRWEIWPRLAVSGLFHYLL